MDSLIHHTMCKHVHLVASMQLQAQKEDKSSTNLKTEASDCHLPLLQALQQ